MKVDEGLNKLVSGRLSTYAVVILMFTYSILLDRDFACACEDQAFDCRLYLTLPSSIILVLILWTDSSFQGVIKYLCSHCCDTCCSSTCWPYICSLVRDILKALLVSVLWTAFVLLDGDWYICCMNNNSTMERHLACIDHANTTERVKIAELKNHSRVIGGFLLFAIIIVGSVFPLLERSKCFKPCRDLCCDRQFLYNKLILEREEKELEKILRDSAKEDLKNKIQEKIGGEDWGKCFDVAVELQNLKPHVTQNQEARGGASERQPEEEPEEQPEEQPGTSSSSS